MRHVQHTEGLCKDVLHSPVSMQACTMAVSCHPSCKHSLPLPFSLITKHPLQSSSQVFGSRLSRCNTAGSNFMRMVVLGLAWPLTATKCAETLAQS